MVTGDMMQDHNPGEPCEHKEYCSGDCSACDGTPLTASNNIAKKILDSKGR